jgi:hypothetical protein
MEQLALDGHEMYCELTPEDGTLRSCMLGLSVTTVFLMALGLLVYVFAGIAVAHKHSPNTGNCPYSMKGCQSRTAVALCVCDPHCYVRPGR